MFPDMSNRLPLLGGSQASLASPSGKKANKVTLNYMRLGDLTVVRRKIPVFLDVIPSHSESTFWHVKVLQCLDSGRYRLLAQWHRNIWSAVHLTYIHMFGHMAHHFRLHCVIVVSHCQHCVIVVSQCWHCVTVVSHCRHCVTVVSRCSWCFKLKDVMKLYLICEQEQLRKFTHQMKKTCCRISCHCTNLWILNEGT